MGLIRGGCQKYVTVAILTAINLLNYVDRYTIAGLLFSPVYCKVQPDSLALQEYYMSLTAGKPVGFRGDWMTKRMAPCRLFL